MRYEIANGDAGVRQTVEHIANLIRDGVASPTVRAAATAIVGGLSPHEPLEHIYAIREFLSAHIRFLRDPSGVELLHSPDWMLEEIANRGAAHVDCDDVAILGGALAGSVGLRVALVTVAFLDRRNPLSHIWASTSPPVQLLDSNGQQVWIDLDTTRPSQALPVGAISRQEVVPVLV